MICKLGARDHCALRAPACTVISPLRIFLLLIRTLSNAEAQIKKITRRVPSVMLGDCFSPIILSNMLGVYFQILLSVRVKPYLLFNLRVLCSSILLQP